MNDEYQKREKEYRNEPIPEEIDGLEIVNTDLSKQLKELDQQISSCSSNELKRDLLWMKKVLSIKLVEVKKVESEKPQQNNKPEKWW
jgi:hypothetical protein